MLFQERVFLDRINQVFQMKLPAFEFWGWSDKNVDRIRTEKERVNLTVCAIAADSNSSLAFSDFSTGILVDPSNRKNFIEGIKQSIEVAHKLDCQRIIVTTGNKLPNFSEGQQLRSIIDGLKQTAEIAKKGNMILLLEPLNTLVDHKGYFLSSASRGFDIVKEVNSPNVKLLYDIYHSQIMEGNLIAAIKRDIQHIGHFHIGDVPGRHEPGTGEINYENVLREINELGYEGYVGLEFIPTGDTKDSLRKVKNIIDKLN